LNGVYIPGDAKATLLDKEYSYMVGEILEWAQKHNADESKHFPVVGVSYGYLSMLNSQMRDINRFDVVPKEQVCQALE